MADRKRMLLPLLVGSLAVFISWIIFKRQEREKRVAELEEAVKGRQEEREKNIEWARKRASLVSKEDKERIGRMNFDQLRDSLQMGSVSCSTVLSVYLSKALQAHEKTNCVTLFVKESVKWAEEWDEKAKKRQEKPPLFGIPISIKECTVMEGYDQTRGYASGINHPSSKDGLLVAQLKSLGAIPFVQTNVPLSLLSFTCGNKIYGWTSNPHDSNRTPGGSSGGESAILAAGGSILGIGGDVGGSIRIPAHYAGIAGIKPSHLRLSSLGTLGSVPGRPLINASEGPMAPSIHTCTKILKQLWSTDWISSRDPYVPPVLWNDELYKKGNKLRIGYYTDDGWFTPTPGCERVVLEAKSTLERIGYTVVPFTPPNVPEVVRLFVACVCVDGGAYVIKNITNDLAPSVFLKALRPLRLPIILQRIAGKLAGLFGWWRLDKFMHALAYNTVEMRENYASIEKYREQFISLMREQHIDLLLCPVNVLPSPPHDAPLHLSAAMNYTAIFNLLDFAAGVVKAGNWTKEDEENLSSYPTTDIWYGMARDYSKNSTGLPLGVQIAGPPYQEETVLRVLGDLEDNTIQ